MSTPAQNLGASPFLEEEAAQTDRAEGTWNPWKGPTPGSFGGDVIRSPYTILEGLGSGAAKGEAVLGGLLHQGNAIDPENKGIGRLTPEDKARAQKQADALNTASDTIMADARERVHALTPDAATTGIATQVLHSVASGGEQLLLGSLVGGVGGGALAVGSGEGLNRTQELKEQGVDNTTATKSGLLAAVTSGAGAFMPGGLGSTLLTRLATGAAGNTGFGMVNRFADHLILANGGYPEMADQQKVWDTTQMLVDAALGTTFGAIHHLGSGAHDAALTANLALKDRQAAPGVAVTPESAGVHQAALEKATQDVLQGKSVDVSGTGIERGEFLKRPAPETRAPMEVMAQALKETGLLDEEANLLELEAQFQERRDNVPRGTPKTESGQLTHSIDEDGIHTVTSENGTTTAKRRGDTLQVLNTETAEAGQGKGEGTARIERLAEIAQRQGLTLTSDTKVSDAAAKVYDRLEKKGYEVTRNPAEPDGEGNRVSTAGRPVFEVKPKPVSADPTTQVLAERPEMKIPNEQGKPVKATDALEAAKPETNWFTATKSAIDCFARRGG